MPGARTDWTVDMLDALPDDGNTYELIDGELFVTPAPLDVHQWSFSTLPDDCGIIFGLRLSRAPSIHPRTFVEKIVDEIEYSPMSSSCG